MRCASVWRKQPGTDFDYNRWKRHRANKTVQFVFLKHRTAPDFLVLSPSQGERKSVTSAVESLVAITAEGEEEQCLEDGRACPSQEEKAVDALSTS